MRLLNYLMNNLVNGLCSWYWHLPNKCLVHSPNYTCLPMVRVLLACPRSLLHSPLILIFEHEAKSGNFMLYFITIPQPKLRGPISYIAFHFARWDWDLRGKLGEKELHTLRILVLSISNLWKWWEYILWTWEKWAKRGQKSLKIIIQQLIM